MRKTLSMAVACAALTLAPRAAEAFCGFYVSGADAKLFNNATMVVLMRDGQRTILSMQNNYQGPPRSKINAPSAASKVLPRVKILVPCVTWKFGP